MISWEKDEEKEDFDLKKKNLKCLNFYNENVVTYSSDFFN